VKESQLVLSSVCLLKYVYRQSDGTQYSNPGGMQGWVDLRGGYIPRSKILYMPKTVTYLRYNRAVPRLWVSEHITYKLCSLTFRCLNSSALQYLSELLQWSIRQQSVVPSSVATLAGQGAQSVTPVWMDGRSPDVGGKLSVTAVRYQITDTGSSLKWDGRKGVCYQLVAGCCNWLAHSLSSPSPRAVYRPIHQSVAQQQWQDTQNATVPLSGVNYRQLSDITISLVFDCVWSQTIGEDLIMTRSWSRQALLDTCLACCMWSKLHYMAGICAGSVWGTDCESECLIGSVDGRDVAVRLSEPSLALLTVNVLIRYGGPCYTTINVYTFHNC